MALVRLSEGEYILAVGEGELYVRSGGLEVFGSSFERLYIPPTKAVPCRAISDSEVEIIRGGIMTLDSEPIPDSWVDAIETIMSSGARKVMLFGGVDAGKTGFATYLLNSFIEEYGVGYVIDADVGQSDIGLPTSVGLGRADRPVPTLLEVPVLKEYCIGLTSPRGLFHRVVEAVSILSPLAGGEPLVLNTTGWVTGSGLYHLKRSKYSVFKPDVSVVFGDVDLYRYVSLLGESILVDRPRSILPRSHDTRKMYRDWRFQRYFSLGMERCTVSKDNVYVLGIPYEKVEGSMDRVLVPGQLGAFLNRDGSVSSYAIVLESDGDLTVGTPFPPSDEKVFEATALKLDIESFSEMGWIDGVIDLLSIE